MKMKRIVVGLDGSSESLRALDWAADLAESTGAEITAVAVFGPGPYMSWGASPVFVPDFEQLRAGLHAELDTWCAPLPLRGVTHRALVRNGSAADELLKEADAEPTDLIVVGSRGRGGFRELVMGSVAHHVTQNSKHPVLIVPRVMVATEREIPALATATA